MEEVLVYVKPICKNNNNTYEYDFYFSETPDFVWGAEWDIDTPVNNNDLTPEITTCSSIKRVITTLPLKTIEETSCYSMEYATYGIMALTWIDLDLLDEYPEKGRLTMHFGETITNIKEKLDLYNWNFKN